MSVYFLVSVFVGRTKAVCPIGIGIGFDCVASSRTFHFRFFHVTIDTSSLESCIHLGDTASSLGAVLVPGNLREDILLVV